MTGSRKKTVAILFAALMITSVLAAGAAWAADSTRGGETFNPDLSTGNVGPGATVFQGEEGIQNYQGFTPAASALDSRPDGDFDLDITSSVVPEGQQTKLYENAGDTSETIRVSTPRVTDMDVINPNGVDLDDGTTVQEDQVLVVTAEWNYMQAEDVQFVVEDQDGFEVQGTMLTNDVSLLTSAQNTSIQNENGWSNFLTSTGTGGQDEELNNSQQGIGATDLSDGDRAVWAIELDDLRAGTYTLMVEGINDFEEGEGPDEAVDTFEIDVTTTDEAELELATDEATQGERVRYTIRGSIDGANHTVAMENDTQVRDNIAGNNVVNIFENVGDVDATGSNTGWVWANVTIDDGVGEGRLDTQYLDDTDVEFILYNQTVNPSNTLGNDDFEIDTASLEIQEGQLTIDRPDQTYVPGQEIDANGTATRGTDDVTIYARDQGEWQIVFESSVDSDGTWEVEDVVLSDENNVRNGQPNSNAANIFTIPGVYRIGIIDSVDADIDGDGNPDSTLTSREFNQGLSNQRSIRIAQPSLSATIKTYNDQVYLGQELEFEGTSIGPDEVLFTSGDSRGGSIAFTVSVDDDDEFDEEESLTGVSNLLHFVSTSSPRFESIPFGPFTEQALGHGGPHSMVPGEGAVAIWSPGRDQVFGDGTLESAPGNPEANVTTLAAGVNSNHRNGRSPSQKREDILEQTIQDTGSDDLVVSQSVRFTDDALTQIDDVVPVNFSNASGVRDIRPGETVVVRGVTNLKPDDNTIVVQPIDGPDVNKITVNSTDEWETDGIWWVTIEVPSDTTPGNYTIQADSGLDSDQVTIAVTPDAQRPLPETNLQQLQNQIQELQNQVDNLEQQNSELQSQVDELETNNEELQNERDRLQERLDELNESDGGDDGEGQPGFTPLVAVVALIAAALLALRMRD